MSKNKTIYDLELHENCLVDGFIVTRVPNGWLYETRRCFEEQPIAISFVPYSKKEDLKNNSKSTKNIKFLTRKELASKLRVTIRTIDTWTKNGVIESIRLGGKVMYDSDIVNQVRNKSK